MAVTSKENLLERLNKLAGEDQNEEAVSLLEDFSDTFDSVQNPGSDWEDKYKTLEKKYRERFFSGSNNDKKPDPEPEADEEDWYENPVTFDDFFIRDKKKEE